MTKPPAAKCGTGVGLGLYELNLNHLILAVCGYRVSC
mgnify:CR=1 FL=1